MIHARSWPLAAALLLVGCASGPVQLPEPRPMVNSAGTRLYVEDEARMRAIYDRLQEQLRNIEQDPTFLIAASPDARDVYPWETLAIHGDTAEIAFQRTVPDVKDVYDVYAHFYIMRDMGRLEEWLPGGDTLSGFALELAIVEKIADAWLLGRSRFDLAPYELLDRLVYAREAGMLEPLLLTLRADEFPEARAAWLEANPGGDEAFRAWYRDTFEGEPPSPPGGGG